MGIYNGSFAFTRYRILGNPGKTTIASLSKLLTAYIAKPLRLDGPSQPESIGWVRPLTASDEQVVAEDSHWDMSDCRVDNTFLLRARYERRRVPASLFQMMFQQKLRDHLKKTGKSMPRAERQELKLQMAQDLLKRTLPVIQFTDVLWREAEGELYVFSASKAVRQRIEQLFHQTFGDPLDLSLVRMDGSVAFIGEGLADESTLNKRLHKVAKIEPAIFAPQQTVM